jgi:hypothetical protein
MNNINAFARKIASLKSRTINAFGIGISGITGAPNADDSVLRDLNVETHKLLALISQKSSIKLISEQKEIVEAKLKVCAVVGIVSESELKILVNELHNLNYE